MRIHAGIWSAFLVVTIGTGCPPKKDDKKDAGVTGGSGTIRIGGEAKPYSIVPEETNMLILVKKLPEGGTVCNQMHDHAVRSHSTQFSFELDKDAPDNSTLEARVFAFGLTADRGSDRDEFDRTRGSDDTNGLQDQIENSVQKHLKSDQFPEMTFTTHNPTSLDGAGTTPVDVHLKGSDSTFTLSGTSTWNGDRLTIEATGTIDGSKHTIPEPGENFSQCVDTAMDVKMKLVFAPGASDAGNIEVPDASAQQPRQFPDDGTCGTTGFEDVRPILVRSCAGCHSDPSVGVVSTPLASFENFRVSTRLHPDIPLYQQALDRVTLDPGHVDFMPPLGNGKPLSMAEIDVVRAWVMSGAHQARCGGGDGGHGPMALEFPVPACGTITFDQVSAVLGDHVCLACHFSDSPGQPALTTAEDGMEASTHNYYKPFNVWETSALRMQDGTMPPYQHTVPPEDIELIWTFAQQEKNCRDGGH